MEANRTLRVEPSSSTASSLSTPQATRKSPSRRGSTEKPKGNDEDALTSDFTEDQKLRMMASIASSDKKWNFFTKAEQDEIASRMTIMNTAAGEEIIKKGEAASFLVLLIKGTFHVVLPQGLLKVNKGTVLGEMAYFEEKPRTADVISVGRGIVALLFYHDMRELYKTAPAHSPALGQKLEHFMATMAIQKLRRTQINSLNELKQSARRSRSSLHESNHGLSPMDIACIPISQIQKLNDSESFPKKNFNRNKGSESFLVSKREEKNSAPALALAASEQKWSQLKANFQKQIETLKNDLEFSVNQQRDAQKTIDSLKDKLLESDKMIKHTNFIWTAKLSGLQGRHNRLQGAIVWQQQLRVVSSFLCLVLE